MKKQREAAKPMIEAVQELQADSRLKSAAYNFLKTDITKLRSNDDFTQAYSGLSACLQLLGPLSRNYTDTLNSMRKLIDQSIRKCLLPACACATCKDEILGVWQDVCETCFKPHLRAEIWQTVGEKTRALFDSIKDPRE
jgi:hypothetical protein